jgi:hypothetical protein
LYQGRGFHEPHTIAGFRRYRDIPAKLDIAAERHVQGVLSPFQGVLLVATHGMGLGDVRELDHGYALVFE